MLVAAWPDVGRKASLTLGAAESRERQATSMDIGAGGRPIHVALLDTPGIWHRETFTSAYVERDVASDWQRPFRAKWTTQLVEDRVKTTFRFLEAKRGRMWRAGIGTYAYPAWFDGDRAMFHLGKRIPAKGFSLVYCLESDGDPVEAARTPADVLRRALDEAAYVGEMDVDGRVMRPAYRPNTVVATATCGVTDRLKPIFAEGQQREKIEYIQAGIEDMMSHLVVLAERADEYRAFVDEMTEYLSASRADRPEMDAYLGEMADITSRMSDVFDHHRENIRDLAYARELGIRTVALAQSVDADVDALSEFMKLKNEWTGMGGSLETLMRQLHTTARKLFQEAGYRSAPDRRAIPFAEEIRRRTKALLREPREYEIWSDY